MPAGRISAKYDDYLHLYLQSLIFSTTIIFIFLSLSSVILPEHDLASISLQEPAHTQVSMSIVHNHPLTPLPLHNVTMEQR